MTSRNFKVHIKMLLAKFGWYKYVSINSYMEDLSRVEKIESILDIGACVGAFSVYCKKLWPKAYIMMMEANTSCEPFLKETGIDYKIGLLGNENRKDVVFYKSKEGAITTGESYYKEATHHFEDYIEEVREMRRLDALTTRQFDFIKIDTQGSELDIINGGMETVRKSKYALLEVATKPYNIGAPLEVEVVRFMESIGFETHFCIEEHIWMDEKEGVLQRGDVFQKDIIFIR